jgi:hypothetical protein
MTLGNRHWERFTAAGLQSLEQKLVIRGISSGEKTIGTDGGLHPNMQVSDSHSGGIREEANRETTDGRRA